MKRLLIIAALVFMVSPAWAAIELDADANGGVDIGKGGTNATTAGAARTNLGVGTGDNPSFNSVHASGGNMAANNAQVTKKWITGLQYTADVTSVIHGGKHFICSATHTASAAGATGDEPGVGDTWATKWKYAGDAVHPYGDNTIYTQDAEPAACAVGDMWVDTNGTSGQRIYTCETANTWVAQAGGSGDMVYPGVGVANSTGSAWGTSYAVGTSANNLVQLNGSAQLPAVSAALLTNFPTLNQNTTGTAAGLAAQYIDWSASSGGSSIANKPTLGTAAALNYGTGIGNLVRIVDIGSGVAGLGFTIDLSSLTDTTSILAGKQAADADLTTWAAVTPGTGVGTFLATPSSANLRSAITDESGTGVLLFADGNIGAGSATTPAANDNDTSIATTAYVQTEITATASDSETLTNKTINTASTGNDITVPLNGVLDGAITDPADADDMIYKKVQNAMTLTDIHCLAEGGGTITVTLQECTSAGASCANIEGAITCDSDGAEDDGTLTDSAIAAGAWIKVLYSAPSGTVNSVAWTVYGTQTW